MLVSPITQIWDERGEQSCQMSRSLHLSGDCVIDINPCEKRMGEEIAWFLCTFLAEYEMSFWIHQFLSWVIGSCRTRDCPRASCMLSQYSTAIVYPLSYVYFHLTESCWAAQASHEVTLLSTPPEHYGLQPWSSKARPRSVVSYYSHLFCQHCRG